MTTSTTRFDRYEFNGPFTHATRLLAAVGRLRALATLSLIVSGATVYPFPVAAQGEAALHGRMDRLEAELALAEDMRAIKRLQRIYGYYLDKGMWEDLSDLFTEDAVANYPAGVYIGRESIRRHLYMNVGGGEIGQNGLGDNRLYNHMNIQPVVHIGPDGQSANGRWRAFTYFGSVGGAAVWAEGVYEIAYVKEAGVWKIETLDYHRGFSAPYETGWVNPGAGRRRSGPQNLPHPADRERSMLCEGFPAACIPPFHYGNPGVTEGARAWRAGSAPPVAGQRGRAADRAAELAQRASVLADEQAIENLIKIYGYYVDRRMWDHVADLFAADATIEMDLRGVYVGKPRIRAFLELLGPQGLSDGELNDHVQLQYVVDVAEDGMSAQSRSREFNMTGVYESHGEWSEGIYTNTYVKEAGVWKIKSLRYYPTFITDYDKGWGEQARRAPGVSETLPPDRPPTDDYAIYPQAHIPPYHYLNPVSGERPRYPRGAGRPSNRAIRDALRPVARAARARTVSDMDAVLSEAERVAGRVKDYHEIENLENAYGYYLDKNLWNDLADLFAEDGSMELAQRGAYTGRERVRGFLFSVFGPEGPVEGRLGNHIKMQPVIHVAEDGQTARIRARMMQQLTFGPRASMGAAVYENEAVNEDGVWKFSSVHAYNTWTAAYDGGWARSPGRRVPGPSVSYPPNEPPTIEFDMFPSIYELPFHYDNPVSGKPSNSPELRQQLGERDFDGYMPPDIASRLREIGARIEAPLTAEIYRPMHGREPYAGVRVERDRSYGSDPRNTLDVFTSSRAGDARPVVVFVYGGGFRGGSKRSEGSPFYDNVVLWAARNGMVGVNANYRLAPDHQWPSGIEDVEGIVRWVKANIEEYGGDPEKLFLWGHSSGGAHVADYLAARARTGDEDGVSGAVLLSSFYDLGDEVSVWQAYYGDDVSAYEDRSSLPGLLLSSTPLMVVDAELDPATFRAQAELLAGALADAGRQVTKLHLAGHSHLSEGYAVGTSDRSLTDPVLGFIELVLTEEKSESPLAD